MALDVEAIRAQWGGVQQTTHPLPSIHSETTDRTESNISPLRILTRPPDHNLSRLTTGHCALKFGFCPWFCFGDILFVAVAPGSVIEAARAELSKLFEGAIVFCDVSQKELRQAITVVFGQQMIAHAQTLCPAELSCRNLSEGKTLHHLRIAIMVFMLMTLLAPVASITALIGWIIVVNAANILIRIYAVTTTTKDTFAPLGMLPTSLPKVSILLPLLREHRVLSQLLAAISRLDYPREKLEVKILVEENDHETRSALSKESLPYWVEVIIIPKGVPTTKPRAMNYALPFCSGQLLGIYDAEDIPDPSQIKTVVQALTIAPPQVACVQASLDFYNPEDNWLTRCFTLDYALWFRVLLHGVHRLGMPLPLGGTSVFFRRDVLEQVGAWDAHNVTEDADLGMRLARFGYCCRMIPSQTLEEANQNYMSWLRQRSRWLKGYAITWLTHMRTPLNSLRSLGFMGFMGMNILLIGGITSYLAAPVYISLLFAGLAGYHPVLETDLTTMIWAGFFVTLPLGNLMTIAIAVLAVQRRRMRGLLLWIPTLPLYWLMGSCACYRAIWELFTNPFHWHKTEHGHSSHRPPIHAPVGRGADHSMLRQTSLKPAIAKDAL